MTREKGYEEYHKNLVNRRIEFTCENVTLELENAYITGYKDGLKAKVEELKLKEATDIERFSKGYASRIPMPKTKEEFKEVIAEAYLCGIELATDKKIEIKE